MNFSKINEEFAAKRACELLGLDPHEKVYVGVDVMLRGIYEVRWEMMLPKVREQYAINSALMEASAGLARIEK